MKKCNICFNLISKRNEKFCSNKCVGISLEKNIKRNCLVCKKEYKKRSGRENLFCSKKCYGISKLGDMPWNKGLDKNDLRVLKYASARAGKKRPTLSGENHWNWQGGLTVLVDRIRTSLEYKLWRKTIYERDNYTCVWCNQYSGKIVVDHIYPLSLILYKNKISILDEALLCRELWDLNNGRVLCENCHKQTNTFAYKTVKMKKEYNYA